MTTNSPTPSPDPRTRPAPNPAPPPKKCTCTECLACRTLDRAMAEIERLKVDNERMRNKPASMKKCHSEIDKLRAKVRELQGCTTFHGKSESYDLLRRQRDEALEEIERLKAENERLQNNQCNCGDHGTSRETVLGVDRDMLKAELVECRVRALEEAAMEIVRVVNTHGSTMDSVDAIRALANNEK